MGKKEKHERFLSQSSLGLMVNLSEAEYKGGGPHFGGKIKILILDKLIEISVLNK